MQKNKTVMVAPFATTEYISDNTRQGVSHTYINGSSEQITKELHSKTNATQTQEINLNDTFSTTYGDSCKFIKGLAENRIEGDAVEFVGPSDLINNELMNEWYKEYNAGIGSMKLMERTNIDDIPANEYPINSVYSEPSGISNITVCPPLLDGTAEDNLNNDTKLEFEKKMMDVEEIKNSEASKSKVQGLKDIYNNMSENIKNLDSLRYGK